jgi:hypothetical protein
LTALDLITGYDVPKHHEVGNDQLVDWKQTAIGNSREQDLR